MIKLLLPQDKTQGKTTARGLWRNDNGKTYYDYLTLKRYDYLSNTDLELLRVKNNQEALFYTEFSRGYIFYNPNKIEVLKKVKKWSIKKGCLLKYRAFLRQLLRKYNGLTIYDDFDRYIIEVFYNIKRSSRVIKQRKLIKKLFENILKAKNITEKINLQIKNDEIRAISSARYYNDGSVRKLVLNIGGIKRFSKYGYSNRYYPNRHEKLGFVIGNRKIQLRFIIYHELHHLITLSGNELEADNYAIENLKQDGLLKIEA